MDFDWTPAEYKRFLLIRQTHDRGGYLDLESQGWLIEKISQFIKDEVVVLEPGSGDE